jgi:hypothetical protein
MGRSTNETRQQRGFVRFERARRNIRFSHFLA